ncbi:MAG: vWA domain-containing protein, partial [Gemmatimonadota bacterium]
MIRRLVVGLAALSLGLGRLAVAQTVQTAEEATLVRCAAGSNRPCLLTTVGLDAAEARHLIGLEPDKVSAAWRASFLRDTALVPRARAGSSESARPVRLLVLVDVSGTMKNVGIGTVRLVLRQFLDTLSALPAGKVRVAIAPFGSKDVAGRINSAPFLTPDSAQGQVSRLPEPTENTALYSAVQLGATRVLSELKQTAPDGLGALVVITDGTENDVENRGDDPGLLKGPEGLQAAVKAVDQDRLVPWMIGLRGEKGAPPNETILSTLAGPRGRKYLVRVDAFELARPLTDVRGMLWSAWDLAVPLASTTREELGRGWLTLASWLALGKDGARATAQWTPPVLALPAFEGIAPAGLAQSGAGERMGTGGLVFDRRLPLGLFLLVLVGLLWLMVPRLVWSPIAPAAAAPAKNDAPP